MQLKKQRNVSNVLNKDKISAAKVKSLIENIEKRIEKVPTEDIKQLIYQSNQNYTHNPFK